MVYYVPKVIKGQTYWYLHESYREGGKVKTRYVAYLGKVKPPKTPIDAYKSKYGDKYLGRKQVPIAKITHGLSLDESNRFYFENGKWIATDLGRQDRIELFAEDIKTGKAIGKGVGAPIEVFYDPTIGEYELIDGAHRLAAYSHLGRKRVPAKVYKKKDELGITKNWHHELIVSEGIYNPYHLKVYYKGRQIYDNKFVKKTDAMNELERQKNYIKRMEEKGLEP